MLWPVSGVNSSIRSFVLFHENLNDAESEDETLEIQDKRKHENQVNKKIENMYVHYIHFENLTHIKT